MMYYRRDVLTPFGFAVLIANLFAIACASSPAIDLGEDARQCQATGDLEDLRACQIVEGDLVIEHLNDTRLEALSELVRVDGSLMIRHNPQLSSLQDLQNLQSVAGDLYLITLPSLDSLSGLGALHHVGGDISVVDLAVPHCRAASWAESIAPRGEVELATLVDDISACSSGDDDPDTLRPVDSLPSLDEMRRGDLLNGVHPELRARIKLMYALLEKEGIPIVFVSGHRPHAGFSKPNRLASWHNLGMAVDLNLDHRSSLQDATDHFDDDEDKWERIGEIAKGLGIIWGARYDDIFHFEWHPGYHARIREHEIDEFYQLAGDDLEEHDAVWPLFAPDRADPDGPPCFGGCYHIPDDGLRDLLDQLR